MKLIEIMILTEAKLGNLKNLLLNDVHNTHCQLSFSSKTKVPQLDSAWNLHSSAQAGKFQLEPIFVPDCILYSIIYLNLDNFSFHLLRWIKMKITFENLSPSSFKKGGSLTCQTSKFSRR